MSVEYKLDLSGYEPDQIIELLKDGVITVEEAEAVSDCHPSVAKAVNDFKRKKNNKKEVT